MVFFGGYGRKTKERGELLFLCFECQDVTSHRLVENYAYEQLYGVRVTKHGTHRMLVCARCHHGWDLSKEQWDKGVLLAAELQRMPGRLTDEQVNGFCRLVAVELFPELVAGDPPEAGSASADTLIATFRQDSAWGGRMILFRDGQFVLGGFGPIGPADVLAYDSGGHLEWAYEGLREWVQGMGAAGS